MLIIKNFFSSLYLSFYFFIIPILIVCAFIFVKYLNHKKDLEDAEYLENLKSQKEVNSFEEAKEIIFLFVDDLQMALYKNFKIFLHFILHIFVIVLGLVSEITDVLYAKARDFFISTATKEKDVVSTFWHHLKEYKKEQVEEKEDRG